MPSSVPTSCVGSVNSIRQSRVCSRRVWLRCWDASYNATFTYNLPHRLKHCFALYFDKVRSGAGTNLYQTMIKYDLQQAINIGWSFMKRFLSWYRYCKGACIEITLLFYALDTYLFVISYVVKVYLFECCLWLQM